ncbi:hypothetical protein AAVH_16736 [Aphelenchoides avenae]|nr:hypothetical protein AAVH_16736 [Aphelenchus avenae]
MDRTVHVDDFANAMRQYMEEVAGPSCSSSDPIASSTNAASFIVPLNYGVHPQQASSQVMATPAPSNGPLRTVAVNIDECTSNQWLESFRHLHISQLGGTDLFQQHWPEYAGIEHAFVEKRNRYINAKAVLVDGRAWRAVFKGTKIEFVNSVQRLDRFVWLIRHHPLELRAMLDKQKTFNEIFRTLQLPSGSRVDALRNDLYDWEEEYGSSLLDVSIYFRKTLVGVRSVEYRCLFDGCTFSYARTIRKGLKFALQIHLNACHSEHLTRAMIPALNDPVTAPSVALVSSLPFPGPHSTTMHNSQPLQYASSSVQNRLMRPPNPSVHTAPGPASAQSPHYGVSPFVASMSQSMQGYLAHVEPTASIAHSNTMAQHSYAMQPTHPQPYPSAIHPPVPDARSFVVRPPAAPSMHPANVAQQGLLQPYATFRRSPNALVETRPAAIMVHTCDGQSTLLPRGARTYRTTCGTHYSSIGEPRVAVGERPATYQAQPTTIRPPVQDAAIMTYDQWLQASGRSTVPFATVQSSSQPPGMQPTSSSIAGRFPILHRSLSGQAVMSPVGASTLRTVQEVVTISDDDDDEAVVVASARTTSGDSSAGSADAIASPSNVEENPVTNSATETTAINSDSASAAPNDTVLASSRAPKDRSYPLTYKRTPGGMVKCDFCWHTYRFKQGVRRHYNSSHRKQREGRDTARKSVDSSKKRLQVTTCPAVMALPLRSSPRSLELRREWPEYAELVDDFNDKWKRYVGYQSELSAKGIASSPSSSASVRLEEYFKEYRAAKWAVEKFELLTESCPKELRKLLDVGMRFEVACESLLTTVAKRTTGKETTASEEEVETQSGSQTSSAEASNGQSGKPLLLLLVAPSITLTFAPFSFAY